MTIQPPRPPSAADLAELIACPTCDTLARVGTPRPGDQLDCPRCGTRLIAPRRRAGMSIIMLALATVILVCGALAFPFLSISASGLAHDASLIDAALAFAGGPQAILSLGLLALIVLIPLTRAGLILYVLLPVVMDRPPARAARAAFAWAERLRPWSMAEVFAIGCAVSLVKVADLARIGFGPAFWMFAGLVLVLVLQEAWMCRWSVWKALEDEEARR